LSTRCNRPQQHALSHGIAGYAGSKFIDYPDRFMPDNEPGFDRILSLQDVDVGAADRGQGYPDNCFPVARPGARHVFYFNVVRSVKNQGFHDSGFKIFRQAFWEDGG